jgi:hypothetical protein
MDFNIGITHAAVPFLIAMLVSAFMVFRRHDTKRRHRSVAQWLIYALRRFTLFLWAVQAGFDAGYLQYRKTLATRPEPLENEEYLGLLLGAKQEA